MDVQTDVQRDRRTDKRNFSPFYRTSSPLGAAAQKREIDRKKWRLIERRDLIERQGH